MKKLILPLFVLALILGTQTVAVPRAYALNEQCPSGNDGDCPGSEVCDTSQAAPVCVASDNAGKGAGNVSTGGKCGIDGDCSGNLACISNRCQIDPSLEDPGTAAAGAACGMNDANGNPIQCPGDQTCQQGICIGATGNATPSAAVTNCGNSLDGFVSLSCIPGFSQAESAGGLAKFFQYLYDLCVGIAVIIAVLQISRAGVMYMTSQGDTGAITEAKHLIGASLTGLALVLAPLLILGFVNPGINNFKSITDDANSLTISQNTGNNADANAANSGSGGTQAQTTGGGCTGPSSSGKYFKTATCDNTTDADNLAATCGPGTKSTVTPICKGTKDAKGNCTSGDGNAVTCNSELDGVNYYAYTQSKLLGTKVVMGLGALPNDNQGATPSDSAKQKAFMNGCASDGGSYKETLSGTGLAHLNAFNLGLASVSCSDSDLKNISVPNNYAGAVCYTVNLTCDAPGS